MIKRVAISNFKSLGSVSVDLEPLTVLIGRSGTGKTNFVEAIRFLRNFLRNPNGPTIVKNVGGWERLFPQGAKFPLTMGFKIDFAIEGVRGDYRYGLDLLCQASGMAPLVQEEYLSLDGEMLFHQQGSKWIESPKVSPEPIRGSLVLAAISGIQEVAIANVYLTEGIGCYSFGEQVLLAGATNGEAQGGLSDNGGNYVSVFAKIVNNLQALNHWKEIVASLRQLNSSVKSVELRAPERTSIVVGHATADRSLIFDLMQESEGFRRFFAHLIALYQTPPKQLMVFDHPEAGIHPGALSMLADEFKSCPESHRGQLILTTHSPDLLNHFQPENVRLVEMKDCVTSIGAVSKEQIETIQMQLLSTGELLTTDPARASVTADA